MANRVEIVDYSRQAEMDSKMRDVKNKLNVIVGCGGIGFWLGIQLAMIGAKHFLLVEGDKIDESNLNRLPVPQTWVGINKAIALSKMITFLRPLASTVIIQKHVQKETISILNTATHKLRTSLGSGAIIWDCTDNARIQKELYKAFKDEYTYRKLGYEAFDVGCYRDFNIWIDEATYQPGYRTSNANAVTSSIVAGLGILYTGLNKREDLNINLENLVGGDYVLRTEQPTVE
jgi:molybdopterin/thiamine biosynthesis adenylyltransferase